MAKAKDGECEACDPCRRGAHSLLPTVERCTFFKVLPGVEEHKAVQLLLLWLGLSYVQPGADKHVSETLEALHSLQHIYDTSVK